VDGVQDNFCLQHREECCDALRICQVKGVITHHNIHQAGIDVLFWKAQHRHGSNGQYADGFADNDDRVEEWSCLKKAVRVFCRLEQKEKDNSLFVCYGEVM